MNRNLLVLPPPTKETSVRDHDYSIRLIKVAGFSRKREKVVTNVQTTNIQPTGPASFGVLGTGKYEVTELLIEPMPMNVIKVLKADGTVTQLLSTNIHLDEICHTEDKLEITPIDATSLQENVSQIICLHETCKICLKDLSDTPEKIPFYDDCGQISVDIAHISSALESMNVEVSDDNNVPKQMCIECFNIFNKMRLFKQICRRSKRALATIAEFISKQQSTETKLEDDVAMPDVVEIKEEATDMPETISVEKDYDDDENLETFKDFDSHFACTKCTKSFNTLSKYSKHQRNHETFICDTCSQTHYSKQSIRQHLLSHVQGSYPCQFCAEIFPTAKRRGVHVRNEHKNELYKCPHCPKEFKVKDTYRVHILKHNPDKKHKCKYCPSQFVHRHHLENHIRTHTRETPFLCNYCGRAFRGEVALRDHLSIHDSKTYPYRRYRYPPKVQSCKLCDYSSVYGNLKKHMIRAHGVGGVAGGGVETTRIKSKKFEFSCHICDKEFRLSTSLTNHMRTHEEVRDFHCSYCKASFRKATYLRLHIDGVHLSKRPHKCDECDAAYLVSNDLRRHKLQKHSTERPFPCDHCEKKFAMAFTLKSHIKRAHQEQMNE